MFDSSVLWLAPTTALTARCGPPYPLDAFCQKKIGTSRGRRRTHPHTHPWTDPQLPSLSAVALITASGRFRSVVGGYWRHRTWMGHLLIGPAPPAARFLFFVFFSAFCFEKCSPLPSTCLTFSSVFFRTLRSQMMEFEFWNRFWHGTGRIVAIFFLNTPTIAAANQSNSCRLKKIQFFSLLSRSSPSSSVAFLSHSYRCFGFSFFYWWFRWPIGKVGTYKDG